MSTTLGHTAGTALLAFAAWQLAPQAAAAGLDQVADAGADYAVIASFAGSGCAQPLSAVTEGPDGTLYGTTNVGAGDVFPFTGCVYKLAPGGAVTMLHAFTPDDGDGGGPRGKLVFGADGFLYGTTSGGGVHGEGTIFRIATDGSGYEVLDSFYKFLPGPEYTVSGLLLATDGNFYGVSELGGSAGAGTVYRRTPAGDVQMLHSFDPTVDGRTPYWSPLIQARDGGLYGTALYGGAHGHGTVFRLDTRGRFEVVHEFSGGEGRNPDAPVMQAADGLFYGVTSAAPGTVFAMDPKGNLTTLHVFSKQGHGGYHPSSGLLQGKDGNLYGLTEAGGANGVGTMYRIDRAGRFAVVHAFGSFPEDGAYPEEADLTALADGSLVGVTSGGGVEGKGTVFRIAPAR